mmetsp:Transcript_14011/g.21794  ORF Transcript_14011/g.21794 Transcript_14011/m.21794 type:complete len:390 (-) Transcript_14011:409-1578(-)
MAGRMPMDGAMGSMMEMMATGGMPAGLAGMMEMMAQIDGGGVGGSFDPSLLPHRVISLPPQEMTEKMTEVFKKFKAEILTADFEDDRNWEELYEMWMVKMKGFLGTPNRPPSLGEVKLFLDCGVLENFLLPSIDHFQAYIAIYCCMCLANGIVLHPNGRSILWERKNEWVHKTCGLMKSGLGLERRWATSFVYELVERDGASNFNIEERKMLLKSLEAVIRYKKERFFKEVESCNLEEPKRYGWVIQSDLQVDVLLPMADEKEAKKKIPAHMKMIATQAQKLITAIQQAPPCTFQPKSNNKKKKKKKNNNNNNDNNNDNNKSSSSSSSSTNNNNNNQKNNEQREKTKDCGHCGQHDPQKKCPCKQVYYCDVHCQKANWSEHKRTCSART